MKPPSYSQRPDRTQTNITSTSLNSNDPVEEFYDTLSQLSPVSFKKPRKFSSIKISPTDNAKKNLRQRRTAIPPRPSVSLSISFLKNLYKNINETDLFRVSLPSSFNEPLSALQKLNEDFEFSHFLDKAAKCSDSIEQMVFVAAFVIASYSNYVDRVYKPFNPLLGETFECDRLEDYGWRSISEQVSHHPPALAMVYI